MVEEKTWDLNIGGKLTHRLTFLSKSNERGLVNFVIHDRFVQFDRETGEERYYRTMTSQAFSIDMFITCDNGIFADYSCPDRNLVANTKSFYPVYNRPDIKKARKWFVNTAVRLMRYYFADTSVDLHPDKIDIKAKLKELRDYVRQLLDEGGFKE